MSCNTRRTTGSDAGSPASIFPPSRCPSTGTRQAGRRWSAKPLRELARILSLGGHVAFEVGEVRNGKLFLERLVWEAAQGLPFERLFVMVNQQEFTKTANCWGVSNNAKGTNSNRIVILRRH